MHRLTLDAPSSFSKFMKFGTVGFLFGNGLLGFSTLGLMMLMLLLFIIHHFNMLVWLDLLHFL